MATLPLDQLLNVFTGEIITPENEVYDQLRSTFMTEGSPAVILRPKTAQDVVVALQFAQTQNLTLSIRSGGHSSPGFGTNKGGVVLDMRLMNEVKVIDAMHNLVRIGSGALWGDVAHKLEKYNLAISSGDTKTVGVGGLTLGGGIGWMVRKYGLTIDVLQAAEIVTADGRILRLSKTENPDLFWAIRGGGGNFGVVTYFEFEAFPINKVYTSTIVYGVDNLQQQLTGWRDYLRTASEDITSNLIVMPMFMGNPPSMMIMSCFAKDDEQEARKAFQPLLELGTVTKQDFQQKKYADILEDAHNPDNIKIISKSALANDFSNELISIMAEGYGKETSPLLMIRSLGGAMNKVPSDATAFAYRDKEILIASVAFVPFYASDEAAQSALALWNKISPFTAGAYSNFLYEATEQDVEQAYPQETYQRLAQIKQQYDPKNYFNQNYNIKPLA